MDASIVPAALRAAHPMFHRRTTATGAALGHASTADPSADFLLCADDQRSNAQGMIARIRLAAGVATNNPPHAEEIRA